MAQSDYVSITLAGYVPGMEMDEEFVGCVFRRRVDSPEVPVRNKTRTGLGQDKSKQFGVRPLGSLAVALGTRGLKRDLIKLMVQATKGDLEKVATKYNVKYPEHELTVEKIQAIMASSKSTARVAKELLAD